MTSFYLHFGWFVTLICGFIFFLLLSLYVRYIGQSFYLSIRLFSLWNNDIELSFVFDYMSVWFRTLILLISSVIMLYSYNYMAPYSKSIYFLPLTIAFIASMLIVVNMSNLFFLILGWDGLGLVSFFLIVYYQNHSSITSGLFTVIINRLGDRFFLASIVLVFYSSCDLTMFRSNIPSYLLGFIITLTFITKRAIFPFSPWLPMAMAAPTPISALVHSSTLVTAGLYLIIRFSYYLYAYYPLIKLLMVLRIFTSFYAGMNSIFEKDLKKIIALSTLSHLGFIGMAFSVGLLKLAFFHILTHALFKSLLFITIGDIMINLNHSQDIRYLSSGLLYTPFSSLTIFVPIINLLGLPNLRGYFSKDLVLEMINYSNVSFLVLFMVFLNVFFTYYYTYQLLYFSFQPVKLLPYQNFHSPGLYHRVSLFIMSFSTLFFGSYFLSSIDTFIMPLPVPLYLKALPLFINMCFFLHLLINLKLFSFISASLSYYFGNIMYLTNVMLSIRSNSYYHLSFIIVKTFEIGLFNYGLNTYLPTVVVSLSRLVLDLSILHPIKLVVWSFIRILFILVLL